MLKSPCVVTVGSLHYDIVVEASHRPVAGETVTGKKWFPKFGGKGGNQAVAAASAGVVSRMVSAVGDDDFSAFLLRSLKAGGVDDRWVAHLPHEDSGMSVAISDASGDYGAVIVSGANLKIQPEQLAGADLWQDARVLVLQNEVSTEINRAAAKAARSRGMEVVLNAAPYRPMPSDLLELVTILVVNGGEAEALGSCPVVNLDAACQAAETLLELVPSVVVTAGGDGVAIASSSGTMSLPAEPVELVSTHGAGDCFTGTFAARLCFGDTLDQAAKAANVAAGNHVSRPKT